MQTTACVTNNQDISRRRNFQAGTHVVSSINRVHLEGSSCDTTSRLHHLNKKIKITREEEEEEWLQKL
jgi:hypothetical protein